MNPIALLAKDVWFLAALFVFLIGLGILFWCVEQLRRRSERPAAPPRHEPSRGMPHPQQEPSYMRPSFAPPRLAEPPPSTAPFANEASVMYSVLEERFSDLAKRISSLESKRETAPADNAPALQPLLKRLDDLEKEIERVRTTVAQAAETARAGDLGSLNEKVSTLQRMMESLALEPSDSPKPS